MIINKHLFYLNKLSLKLRIKLKSSHRIECAIEKRLKPRYISCRNADSFKVAHALFTYRSPFDTRKRKTGMILKSLFYGDGLTASNTFNKAWLKPTKSKPF